MTIDLIVDEPVSSRTNRIGDAFRLRLARAVSDAAGRIIIPAGTEGEGQVIHAAKAGGAGRAGELILAARFLRCGERRIRLGHLHLDARGRDSSGSAAAVGAAAAGASVLAPLAGAGTLLAFAIRGRDVVVPAGAPATARIMDEAMLAQACAASIQDQQGEGS